MESMNTEQLIGWNRELSTLLCMPVEDRENLGWQIAVGDHLEKFAKSWNSTRIAELENSLDEAEALIKRNAELMNGYLAGIAERDAQIIHQTAISACRIEERERLQAQIADLKRIAVEERARYLEDFIHEFDPAENRSLEARRQLSEEHPEAFG